MQLHNVCEGKVESFQDCSDSGAELVALAAVH